MMIYPTLLTLPMAGSQSPSSRRMWMQPYRTTIQVRWSIPRAGMAVSKFTTWESRRAVSTSYVSPQMKIYTKN